MTCNSQIREETIIGVVRGELHLGQEHSLKKHIGQCKDCKELYQMWSEVFQGITDDRLPSSHIKKKVMKTIKKQQKNVRFRKPAFIILSTCFAAIMLLIGYTMNPSTTNGLANKGDFNTSETIGEPFLVNDNTKVYEISPEWNDRVRGYAWINPYSNEMMLLVDGLNPISLNDYQAWIQTADELKNAGLLKVNGQTGQLYINDGIINQFEHIMVSKEPLGGSNVPTDPNPFLIKLNAK